MKIKQIIETINKRDDLYSCHADFDDIYSELSGSYPSSSYDYMIFSDSVEQVYYAAWYCEDTYVGYSAIKLDGCVVALAYQSGRKSDVEYKWVSQEHADKTLAFLESCLEKSDATLDFIDQDEEFGEYIGVDYSSELLTNDMLYCGDPVKVIDKLGWISKEVRVKFIDGKEKVVSLEDCAIEIFKTIG